MKQDCSGIILSGGLNTGMKGINQAFLKINGILFIDIVANLLREIFDDVWLITKEATAYERNDIQIAEDILAWVEMHNRVLPLPRGCVASLSRRVAFPGVRGRFPVPSL